MVSGPIKSALITVSVTAVLGTFVMGVLMAAGVVRFKSALRSANEAATLQDLKSIATAEVQYFNTHDGNFGSFNQMVSERILGRQFSEANPPASEGYVFALDVRPRSATESASFAVNADPQSEECGSRHFYIDSESGAIHVNADAPASATDPPLGR